MSVRPNHKEAHSSAPPLREVSLHFSVQFRVFPAFRTKNSVFGDKSTQITTNNYFNLYLHFCASIIYFEQYLFIIVFFFYLLILHT
jgi:hypothetical protein